jgi:hypothetical protein
VIAGKDNERQVIGPDQFQKHQGGLDRTRFGCRDHHQITGMDALAVFFMTGLDAERKILTDNCHEKKRVGTLHVQDIVANGNVHISTTSSDWQEGHMGRLPIPLNCSPQSLHR